MDVLFICGSINQTTQMHQIACELAEHRAWFTPYYGNADFTFLRRVGLLEATIGGNKLRSRAMEWLSSHGLPIDLEGRGRRYDLVFHCSDLVVPNNIRRSKVVLVQEGMTDPENFMTKIVARWKWVPGWTAGTSATGLSDAYDRFCVASEGYKDLFVRRGARAEKIVVTGIPNFDDCESYKNNDFPLRDFVLVCTTDIREVFGFEDRPAFLRKCVAIAAGRPLVFKLHPNEHVARATREIERHAPGAKIFTSGSAEAMVANCSVLVTQYSSLAYVGLALGKEVHSFFDDDELRRLLPLQNKRAARNIADVARAMLGAPKPDVARASEARA